MTAPPKNSTVTTAEPQPFFSSSVVSQEMGLKVGQEASFAVQLNGARGLIDAKIHTPSGAIEECCITELDSGESEPSVEPQNMLPAERTISCASVLSVCLSRNNQ